MKHKSLKDRTKLDTIMCQEGVSGSLRSRARCPCLCCQSTAADAQRKRDLGPPHIHVFAALLKVARDCLAHLTPPPDTVQALTGYRTKLGQVPRERLVTVAKPSKTRQPDQTEDTAEAHGRGNAGSGIFGPHPAGCKVPPGSCPPSHFERVLSKQLNKVTDA